MLVAALIHFVVGAIWHSPPVLGAAWMRLSGVGATEMKADMAKAVPIDLVSGFVMSFVLLHAVHYAGAATLALGAVVGFCNWIGFVATIGLAGVIYEKYPFRLFLINRSGQLVALCLMGTLLALWVN